MKVINIGEETKIYQIIENKNKELLNKIVNYEFTELELKLSTTSNFKIIGEFDSENYQIVPIVEPKTYKKSTIDNMFKEQKINQINNSFDVLKEFKEQYGIICRKTNNELNIVDLIEVDQSSINNFASVRLFGKFYDYVIEEYGIYLDYKFKSYYGMLGLYLDLDGNFKNRKYNIDLEEYEDNCVPDVSSMFNVFKNNLKEKVGLKLKVDEKNIIYNDNTCFVYEVEEERIKIKCVPVRKDKVSYQEHLGAVIYKLPKKLKEITFEDYINIIESKISDENKEVFYKTF
jgi:hypothetical protein